jgi:hypothetical protein
MEVIKINSVEKSRRVSSKGQYWWFVQFEPEDGGPEQKAICWDAEIENLKGQTIEADVIEDRGYLKIKLPKQKAGNSEAVAVLKEILAVLKEINEKMTVKAAQDTFDAVPAEPPVEKTEIEPF